MKPFAANLSLSSKQQLVRLLSCLLFAAILTSCGQTHPGEADHFHDGSHADSAQSFSGATHKEGTGITLLDETRELLGIQTVEVQEQVLPRTIRFTARLFAVGTPVNDKSQSLASGTVSTNDAAVFRPGLAVHFEVAPGATVSGTIQQVSRLKATGEAEVIVALPSSPTLKQGDFGEITVVVPGEKAALVVPREAVIRGTTGDLVYVVNGDAYTLTWVEVGSEAIGLVEITDGLLAGDSVVTRGAMDLWLVELRAVKGGQGCCPAPPKKGKG